MRFRYQLGITAVAATAVALPIAHAASSPGVPSAYQPTVTPPHPIVASDGVSLWADNHLRQPLPTPPPPPPTTTVPDRAFHEVSRSAPIHLPTPVPTTTVVHEAVSNASSGNCGSHAYWLGKSYPQLRAQAHACWDGLIDQYSWPTSTAFNVMFCESKGDPTAHNPSGANGLFQDMDGPYDPASNVEVAYNKWRGDGDSFYGPWQQSAYCWG